MKIPTIPISYGAKLACSAGIIIVLNGCMPWVLVAKDIQIRGSSNSEQVKRYQERRNQTLQISKSFWAKCSEQANEHVIRPIEGVRVLKPISMPNPSHPFAGGISGFGGPTHPHYMFFRLGLESLEVESDGHNPRPVHGYVYFDLDSRRYSLRDESRAEATVIFEQIGNVEEEKLGFYGRRITVIDNRTKEITATRTEFVGSIEFSGTKDFLVHPTFPWVT